MNTAIRRWIHSALDRQTQRCNASNAAEFYKGVFLRGLQATDTPIVRPDPRARLLTALGAVKMPKEAAGFAAMLYSPDNERRNNPLYHATFDAVLSYRDSNSEEDA